MKTAGIILLCLQAVSILGIIANGEMGNVTALFGSATGIFEIIGFFLPSIIGVFLLIKANKKAGQQ